MRISDLITGRSDRRSYVGEMELALEKISTANSDCNPNRQAQLRGWTEYGLAVAIARRSKGSIPDRPDEARMV